MDEMIEHCAQFVDEVNKHQSSPITREEYIGQMKAYFHENQMVIGTSAMIASELDCIVNQYTDSFCNPMVTPI